MSRVFQSSEFGEREGTEKREGEQELIDNGEGRNVSDLIEKYVSALPVSTCIVRSTTTPQATPSHEQDSSVQPPKAGQIRRRRGGRTPKLDCKRGRHQCKRLVQKLLASVETKM